MSIFASGSPRWFFAAAGRLPRPRCGVIATLGLLAALGLSGTEVRADWPAFLGGQQRHQAVDTPSDIPTEWSPADAVLWETPLPGHGQSSPVVVADRVYLTAVEGPMKESNLVLAFDLASGEERWRYELESSMPVENNVYTSRGAPTPAADARGVYAFFESGDLVALDPSGKVRWQRSLVDDYEKYQGRFGLGASVAQLEDRIFVLADNEGPSYLLAVDKEGGETIWKTTRESRVSWSSPMIVTVKGQPQVVVSSSGTVDGYDPATGEQLWTYEGVGGNTVASPVPFGDGRFLIGASPGRDGKNAQAARQSNLAMEIRKTDDGYEPVVLWQNERATSSFGSPIVHRGHAYYTNRAGVLYCLDVETGEIEYTMRLAESNWATPTGIGDRVFFFGKSGNTTVVAVGDDGEKLAENRSWPEPASSDENADRFSGEIQYGIAVTDLGILVRTGSRLFAIGAKN